MNLAAAFAESVRAQRDRPAVFYGDAEISYARLWEQSCAVARRLRGGGVGRGDRVAVWLKNCPEFPASLFGVWLAGGVVVVINNFLKPDEVAYILGDAGANIVLSDTSLAEHHAKVAALLPSVRFLDIIECASASPASDATPASLCEDDLAALLYTSGTTGRPKGAMLTHGNFLSNVRSCLQCLEVTPADRIVVLLPQFHSFMFTVGTLLPLLAGASIVLVKTLHPLKHILDEALHRRATLLPAVPQIYRALAALPPGVRLPFRLCVSGGAPLPLEVLRQFRARFPEIPFVEGYGPTESSPVASVNPIHSALPNEPLSCGRPAPEYGIVIEDDRRTCRFAGREPGICSCAAFPAYPCFANISTTRTPRRTPTTIAGSSAPAIA